MRNISEEKRGNGHKFWELVLSNVIGTAVGYAIAYYTTRQNFRAEKYIDKTIEFLEGVKKKTQSPGYEPEKKQDI